MKWTPENDQTLLLKILETHAISLKADKVRDAWPQDREIPSIRAIQERLVRLRKGTQTPRKPRSQPPGTASPKKRAHSTQEPGTPTKRKREVPPAPPRIAVKNEPIEEEVLQQVESAVSEQQAQQQEPHTPSSPGCEITERPQEFEIFASQSEVDSWGPPDWQLQ